MKDVLLVNLGTPAAPTPAAVKAYLREFLSDPKVVALPRFLWLPLLHLVILPTRSPKSAHKYQQIWTPEGSPLKVHTERQAKLLGASYAMRYGEPNLRDALKQRPSLVFPLYPQYSESATGTVLELARGTPAIRDFHDHPAYIDALAAVVRRKNPLLLLSFHGLPKQGSEEYERQCHTTARLLAEKLGLRKEEWMVTFQSRFGAARWLEPYTQPTLEALARKGVKEVDVFCPGFVSDCLETLEEIAITARDAFLAAGGRDLNVIPCLNEAPEWISAMAEIASGAGARP